MDNFYDVRKELRDYTKSNWSVLGLELGLEKVLDKIHAKHKRDGDEVCMDELLKEWLRRNHDQERLGCPTWRSLAAAVEKSGNQAMAERIRENHT